MKKAYRFISLLILFPLFANCMQMEEVLQESAEYIVHAEMVNDETKTSVTDKGYFTWTENDQIWLHTTGGGVSAILRSGAGTADAQFAHGAYFGKMTGKAVYPYNDGHSISGNALNIVLPSEYDLGSSTENTNALLYAYSKDGVLKFSHMAGVMRFHLKNVPAGASQLKLTLDKKISGNFEADLSDNRPLIYTEEASDDSEKSIALNFDALTEASDLMFYFPLPIGTYNSLVLELNSATEPLWLYSNKNVTNVIKHKGLILMPEVKIGPYIPDYTDNCVDLSAEGTANSYIVSESGKYRFTPNKGNSTESVGAISSVEVLWESFGNNETPDVGSLVKYVAYLDGSICFTVPETFKEGNAVIAAKDASGTILWSWHMWLTDQPEEQEYNNKAGIVMDRNLGAVSATPGDIGALGLLYQWGRKDPFLGLSSGSNVACSTGNWPAAVASDPNIGTIEYAIANPTTFITANPNSDDWFYVEGSAAENTRWQKEKTMYDPCPDGWSVIPDGVWTGAGAYTDMYPGTYTYDSSNRGVNFSNMLGQNTTIWYPSAGRRFGSDGEYSGYDNAGYWTSTGWNNSSYASAMNMVSYMIRLGTGHSRAQGYSVRCYKVCPPEPPKPTGPMESTGIYYKDSDGTTIGEGVLIDGVVWAPVNVGASLQSEFGDYFNWIDAHRACPDGWRLPTHEEMSSLQANNWWNPVGDVNGSWFYGSSFENSSIFLPAAGNESGSVKWGYSGYYLTMNRGYSPDYGSAYTFTSTEKSSTSVSTAGGAYSVRCVYITPEEQQHSEITINGLKWKTMNVGASEVSETGNYYKIESLSKVCPDGWRVPTLEEYNSVSQNHTWGTVNGVDGYWMSGTNILPGENTGIFLPYSDWYSYRSSEGYERENAYALYLTATPSGNGNLGFKFTNAEISNVSITNSNISTPVRCVSGSIELPYIRVSDLTTFPFEDPGTQVIPITSNVEGFNVEVPEEAASWLSAEIVDNQLVLTAADNLAYDRSASVKIKAVNHSNAYVYVTVRQNGMVTFDEDNCIYYRPNTVSRWSGDNYYCTRSHIECSANAYKIEMKFKLTSSSDVIYLASGSNYEKESCDFIKFSGASISIKDIASVSLKSFDVSATDLITLIYDVNAGTIKINNKTVSVTGAAPLTLKYLFSAYYYDRDDGVWEEYEGVPENSALYYVKMYDADGNQIYFGHAAKVKNSAGELENCWYANNNGNIHWQYAYDSVNKGGYTSNF